MGLCPTPLTDECKNLENYLETNKKHMIEMAKENKTSDAFWNQVALELWRLQGIDDAFNGREPAGEEKFKSMDTIQFDVLGVYLLQLSGDLWSIIDALRLQELSLKQTPFGTPMVQGPSCSALIKKTPDNNIFLSHVTWSPYSNMLRVLKFYNLAWRVKDDAASPIVPGRNVSFSSYPALVGSIDDFYITSSKLVAIETTFGNFNNTLINMVKHGANSSVLEVFRVTIANRLATSGSEWVDYFSKQNSGTYNNEWMIFDAKKYNPQEPNKGEGVLTIAEQLPGVVVHDDLTQTLLTNTYWPSYNIPYFPQIFQLADYPSQVKKYGNVSDYHECPRAKIFKRDHDKVKDLQTMLKLMRYNDFTHDPLSTCNCTPPYTSEFAISARNELNDPQGTYPAPFMAYRLHGGTDAKITDLTMLETFDFLAVSGPTFDQVPAFQWSKVANVSKPLLQPDLFKFDPVMTNFGLFIG